MVNNSSSSTSKRGQTGKDKNGHKNLNNIKRDNMGYIAELLHLNVTKIKPNNQIVSGIK